VAVDVNRLVRDTVDLMRPAAAGAGVEIALVLEPDLVPLRGHPEQLQQVILNLVVNAVDATPGGGRVSVATREAGGALVLEVVDTGHGIPDAQRKEIFEPFFSTKESGRGTGLGLYIASQIVQEHRGAIEVDSEEGHGTAMRVILPHEAG
jgi:two-component system NtrC family sensor kinase